MKEEERLRKLMRELARDCQKRIEGGYWFGGDWVNNRAEKAYILRGLVFGKTRIIERERDG